MLLINLDDLDAHLSIKRCGGWEVFSIKLFNGRLEGMARRTVYDRPNGTKQSEIIKSVTLENFQTELSDWPAVAIWMVRGLWGVPLEYGKEENVSTYDRLYRIQSDTEPERMGNAPSVAVWP